MPAHTTHSQKRKAVDVMSFVKSPYGLMIVFSLFIIVVLPRLKVQSAGHRRGSSSLVECLSCTLCLALCLLQAEQEEGAAAPQAEAIRGGSAAGGAAGPQRITGGGRSR